MSRRFLRDRMQRAAYATPRMFNGQVYDVPAATYCRVVIQGTDTLVVAWFSRTGYHKPAYVVPGAPVQCQFKEGSRAFIEVVSPGTVIPTTNLTITTPAAADALRTGCQVFALPET